MVSDASPTVSSVELPELFEDVVFRSVKSESVWPGRMEWYLDLELTGEAA